MALRLIASERSASLFRWKKIEQTVVIFVWMEWLVIGEWDYFNDHNMGGDHSIEIERKG